MTPLYAKVSVKRVLMSLVCGVPQSSRVSVTSGAVCAMAGRLARVAPAHSASAISLRFVAVDVAAMDQEAGGLVDGDQVIVAIEDGQHAQLRRNDGTYFR